MSIEVTLSGLADEHLERMAKVGYSGLSETLRRGNAGETFGCEANGVYCDVGDRAEWVDSEGGDIRLTAFAYSGDRRIERSRIIPRKSN